MVKLLHLPVFTIKLPIIYADEEGRHLFYVRMMMIWCFFLLLLLIAEQMGRILQRTAISTNIKERLDFSCALFGPDGGLVSNAPHIPVHLGAMQEAVQFQVSCAFP